MAAEQLCKKIMSNDIEGVKAILDSNKFCINLQVTQYIAYPDLNSRIPFVRALIIRCGNTPCPSGFSLLHYAVVNVLRCVEISLQSLDVSIEICKVLLDSDADPTATIKDLNPFGMPLNSSHTGRPLTPADLLEIMQGYPISMRYTEQKRDRVRVLIHRMRGAEDEWKKRSINHVSVPQGVYNLLVQLRVTDTPDAMTFCCSDGVDVIAHPMILAATSPYFKHFFSSSWTNVSSNKQWKTRHTSVLMNIMLDYVYTGHVDHRGFQTHCKELYAASAEYELDGVLSLARNYLINGLSMSSIREALELAHLYNDEKVIKACHDFVKADALNIVMTPSFAVLSVENPDLWEKLRTALVPCSSSD
jgi:BTB/POZ domain